MTAKRLVFSRYSHKRLAFFIGLIAKNKALLASDWRLMNTQDASKLIKLETLV